MKPRSFFWQQRLEMAGKHLWSLCGAWTQRQDFDGVEKYCMFLGYPRSSHTLLGAILDAHPDVVMAHELDVLRHLRFRFSRNQLYALLIARSQWFASRGWQWMGYSYAIPGQWQGRRRRLRVIGDKKGGASTRRLQNRPELLDELRRRIGAPVKVIHVIRNPYDNIAAMAVRGRVREQGLDHYIGEYFRLTRVVAKARASIDAADWCDVRSESFIAEPLQRIPRLCRFLGIDAPDDYVRDCASIIFPTARQSRHKTQWSPRQIARVAEEISRHSFLRGYCFHDVASAAA